MPATSLVPHALTDLGLDEFEPLAEEYGERAFVGRNLRRWVYERRATDFDQMTDLPRRFRERLRAETRVRRTSLRSDRLDGTATRALLLELLDGRSIETVLIPEGERNTVCVSTQVGCAVSCVFCASGMNGLTRNLSPGEIVEQTLLAQDLLREGERLTNVVVMGIGEPTMNMKGLLGALERWSNPQGLGLGARRITISTVGYPRRIRELAELGKAYGLAISLHAPRQDLRARLLPGAAGVELPQLLDSARLYFQKTGRRVTFEYVLLDGLNASLREAQELAELLEGLPCFVNLIPVNPVDGLDFRRPGRAAIEAFRLQLESRGIAVTQRKVRGDGIAAACGQLRLREDSL